MKKISVVIPTLNRRSVLINSILSLVFESKENSIEVIIVDQSDLYDRNKLRNEIVGILSTNMALKYVQVDFKSLTKARNVGLSLASSNVILFLDDDIEVVPGLIRAHLSSYSCNNRIGAVGGRVIECPDIHTNSKKIGASVNFLGRSFRNFSSEKSGYVCALPGGNMSFTRKTIDAVGEFDERFIGTSELEETDYCYRVKKVKYELFYNANAAIKHLIHPTGGCRDDFRNRQYYRMHNLGLFYAKHYNRYLFPILFIFQFMVIVRRMYSAGVSNKLQILNYVMFGLYEGCFISIKKGSDEE
jgi:glycosyltransferase involved in cell wall biosynthesis